VLGQDRVGARSVAEGEFAPGEAGRDYVPVHTPNGEMGDPGWYRNPEGTVARAASAEELRRDGVEVGVRKAPATTTSPVVYTCRHHPEVRMTSPGRCPKCNMTLTPAR